MKRQPVQKREKKEHHGFAAIIRDPYVILAGILVLGALLAIFAPVGDRDGITNLQFGLDLEGGSWIQLEFQADVVTVQTPVDISAVASSMAKTLDWNKYLDTAADVVIEWDSLYGLVDAGGFTHTTDSTQTVAIRESAVNCVIENITISNYWNTQDRMDEAKLAIERGLALLVQADRFIMKNSGLLGIQDTLELFTGRQYFENVFISGYTDFIFGTNNTTYFKNCTIHVIDTVKDDQGTAGSLTAFKGSNKGASDSIVYGAIFDECKFTADEGVMAGKTAIGRTWGAHAAVAVINSELGGHISVDGYDKSENKNKRYISMNGIHPTDETVQFVEYHNTGAGAIIKFSASEYYVKFDTWIDSENYPLQAGDIIIIEGIFVGTGNYAAAEGVQLKIEKTFVVYNGSSFTFSTKDPRVINVGAMYAQGGANWSGDLLNFALDANEAPSNSDWSVEYVPVSNEAIKLIRNGETKNIANTGAGNVDSALDSWKTVIEKNLEKIYNEFG